MGWLLVTWLFQFVFQLVVCQTNDWDLLIFTQHWPNTVCLQYEESGHNHVCALPKISNRWTVHGVWPTKLHTVGPAFCNTSMMFDPLPLEPIKEDLITWWPNLEGGQEVASLWEHEWSKHGTCAITLPVLGSEEKYFSQGLDWLKKYDMTEILSDNGVIPSDSQDYQLEDIHQAVLSKLNVRPHIACVKEKHSKKPYLFELRICFDKALGLVDCDGTVLVSTDILGNCPSDEAIRYPRTLPPLIPPPLTKKASIARTLRSIMEILAFLDWVI